MYRKSAVISTKLAGGKTVQPTLILVISKFLTELLSRPGNPDTERICVRWFRGKLQQPVLITTWIWHYCKNLNIKYWSKLTAWKYWSCSGQLHADTTVLIMLIRIVLFLYPVLLSCFTLRLLVYILHLASSPPLPVFPESSKLSVPSGNLTQEVQLT